MTPSHQPQAIRVVGIELRTTNAEAAQTIPPFWARFAAEGVLDRIADRRSADVYAVYTHFEHAGIDNAGRYSLIIGASVAADAPVPPGMSQAVLPAGPRALFKVPAGRVDLVGAEWQKIWQRHDLRKAFIADFERYSPDGGIEIGIGLQA